MESVSQFNYQKVQSASQPKAAATSKGALTASAAASENTAISPSFIAWALSQILAKTTCENDDSSKHVLDIFESSHPYVPSSGEKVEVIDLPFARSILVTFDSKSFTENSEDILTFYTDESCQPHSIARARGSNRELRFS